jgi:hypothetical protein
MNNNAGSLEKAIPGAVLLPYLSISRITIQYGRCQMVSPERLISSHPSRLAALRWLKGTDRRCQLCMSVERPE